MTQKIIILPTVQHTGSRLVDSIFRSKRDFKTTYAHVNLKNIDTFVELAKEHATIVPLRHPLRVAQSFESRGKLLDDFFSEWNLIISMIAPLDPMYIHVDLTGKRDSDLTAIGDKFDINVGTIWPYVGKWPWCSEHPPGIKPLDEIRLINNNSVMDFIDRNSDFFGAHYEC